MAAEKNIPMRVVRERTGLTSRQIRYYDQVGLIFPDRSRGNQRLFSEEDIERMKKVKKLLEEGFTVEAIKGKLNQPSLLKDSQEKIVSDWTQRLNKGDLSSLLPVSGKKRLKEKIKRSKE